MAKKQPEDKRRDEREETVQQIYTFIQTYLDEIHHAPSIRNIAEGCYMSRSGVSRYLDLLEGRGWIARAPGIPRSISITDPQRHR